VVQPRVIGTSCGDPGYDLRRAEEPRGDQSRRWTRVAVWLLRAPWPPRWALLRGPQLIRQTIWSRRVVGPTVPRLRWRAPAPMRCSGTARCFKLRTSRIQRRRSSSARLYSRSRRGIAVLAPYAGRWQAASPWSRFRSAALIELGRLILLSASPSPGRNAAFV
jgi:hypothetical protein